jgi:chromosome segregation ATPase
MTELEQMADLLNEKKREIITIMKDRNEWKEKHAKLSENFRTLQTKHYELEKLVKNQYNEDAVKALMDAHEIIRAENKELHKRVDAAYAGVAMDASAKKHYLQAIIERLDGIKASVEAIQNAGN